MRRHPARLRRQGVCREGAWQGLARARRPPGTPSFSSTFPGPAKGAARRPREVGAVDLADPPLPPTSFQLGPHGAAPLMLKKPEPCV